MTCKQCRNLLSAYLDGALPGSSGSVAEHLQLCPACRRELEALAHVTRLVASLPVPTLPVDLTSSVLARATARPRPRQSWAQVWRQMAATLRRERARAMAVGMLILIAGAGPSRGVAHVVADWPTMVAGAAGSQMANLSARLIELRNLFLPPEPAQDPAVERQPIAAPPSEPA